MGLDSGSVHNPDYQPIVRQQGGNYAFTPYAREQETLLGQDQIQMMLLTMSHDAMMVCDREHHLLYLNRAAEELYGWKLEEIKGRDIQKVFGVSPVQEVDDGLTRYGRWQGELERVSRDGRVLIVESSQVLVHEKNGNPPKILKVERDITRHKLAEAQIDDYLEMMTTAFEMGLWSWNIPRDEIFMVPPSVMLKQVQGKTLNFQQFLDLLHPDDREPMTYQVNKAIDEHIPYINQFRVVNEEGHVTWLAAYGRAIYDEDGKPLRLVGVEIDISQQKKIEEDLLQTNERTTAILESISDGFILLDNQWRYTFVNSKACEILGRTRDELLGQKFWEVHPQLSQKRFEERLYQGMQEKTPVCFEYFMGEKKRWYTIRAYPSHAGISIYCQDITEQKYANDALRRSEAKFRRLFDSNITAIAVASLDSTFIEANDAFLRLIGYTREELKAGKINWTDLTLPEHRERDVQAVKELKETGVSQPFEKAYIHKNGRIVPVLVAAAMLDDGSERCICFDVDLTELKELEKQRESIMGVISHELRTPLTAINGSLQLALRRLHRKLQKLGPEVGVQFLNVESTLDQSLRQTRVLDRLIGDLVESTRITTGKLKLANQKRDLVVVVRESVEDIHYTVPDRILKFDIIDEPVPVFIDSDRIKQVVANFLTNAFKYSPQDTEVEVGVGVMDHKAKVWVKDHGPGLSPEAQARIWDSYYRASNAKDYSGSGVNLGLGLYISKTLITEHKGEIGVESKEGEGSTFWFTLPLLEEPSH